MIILDATTKTLEVILNGAVTTNQLDYHVDFVDLDASFVISTASESDGTSNNGTAVTMLAAPAANHTRQVKFLTVYNKDTVAAVVTVRINNNGTFRNLVKTTLAVGDTLQYAA